MRKLAYGFVWIFVVSIPSQELGASMLVNVAGTISRLVGLSAGLVAFVALIYEGRIRTFSVVHGLMILFLAWGGLSYLWSAEQSETFGRLITNVQLLIMIVLFAQFSSTKEETHGLVLAYVVGAAISLIELLRRHATGVAWQSTMFIDRYTAFDNNPNDYALALAIAVPMAWYLVLENRKNWEVLFGYAFIGLGGLGVILTGSRGGLLSLVAGLLGVPLSLSLLPRSKKLVTIGMFGLAVMIAIQVTPERVWTRLATIEELAPDAIPDTYLGEMEGPNIRAVVWRQGFREVSANPQIAVIGVGAAAYQYGVEPVFGERLVAHNVFISVFIEQGGIGFGLFLAIIWMALSPVRYMTGQEKYLWIFTLLSWAVGVSFITWEHTKNTWFVLGVLAARGSTVVKPKVKKHRLISSVMMRGGLRLHTR